MKIVNKETLSMIGIALARREKRKKSHDVGKVFFVISSVVALLSIAIGTITQLDIFAITFIVSFSLLITLLFSDVCIEANFKGCDYLEMMNLVESLSKDGLNYLGYSLVKGVYPKIKIFYKCEDGTDEILYKTLHNDPHWILELLKKEHFMHIQALYTLRNHLLELEERAVEEKAKSYWE